MQIIHKLNYNIFGIIASMPAILFIHGFATGPSVWKEQIKEFSKDYDVSTELEQIDCSNDIFMVGWSMGGWKALDIWEEHHRKIKGLILVSAFPKYVKSSDYPCGTSLALLRKLENKFLTDYKSGMYYFYDLIFKDKKQHYLIDELPVPPKEDLIHWFQKLREEDKRNLLPRINTAVLIIQGDKDPIVSMATAQYLCSKIKKSELRIFPGSGHAPFLEQGEKFNQILRDFLAKNADG